MLSSSTGRGVAAFVASILLFYFLQMMSTSHHIHPYLPSIPEVPSIKIEYHKSLYNASKVALLIENRPQGMIAPMMLHMMSTLTPDWRFQFMGSVESVAHVNKSAAVRQQVKAGKLDLTYIPKNMSTDGQEMISRFLTTLWLYETVLAPAEWLLIYQTDSMMCGNAKGSLDDWLDYDWVGAPWDLTSRYGGNGGLSLRRVSSMIEVLKHQQRQDFSDPEDVWLTERLAHLPNSRTANGSESARFSGERYYFGDPVGYEPLGYHTGGSGEWLAGSIWGSTEKREHIYKYCPEMKLTLKMDLRSLYSSTCNVDW